MSNKKQLIDLIQDCRQTTLEFIDGLSEAERNAPGTAQKWSAKDNIAHMLEWIERFCQNLDTARGGEAVSETEEPIDQANLTIFEQYNQAGWEAIIQKVKHAYHDVVAQVEKMTEEELQTTQFFTRQGRRPLWQDFAGSACIHPVMHLTQVLIQHGHIDQANRLMAAFIEKLLNLDESISWRGLNIYNLACHYSQVGEKDKAIARLGEALRMVPEVIEWSKQDPDLNPLRDEPAYQELMHSLESA
jgi:hypothetical protein